MNMSRALAPTGLVGLALVVSGCGSATGASSGTPGPADSKVSVVASFYPLQYAAARIGGDHVSITNLTAPGGEPHDLELTPQQVGTIADANLVLYIKDFQPAVDDAVNQSAATTSLDVSQGIARLPLPPTQVAEAKDAGGPVPINDPHIWLDPLNMTAIGNAVAKRLSTIDPANSSTYDANAASLTTDMSALDAHWSAGTKNCANKNLVVSHEAFGYLSKRFGFSQLGIAGLTPDAEPSTAKVAEVADFVRAHNVKTIYYETLVDPKVAQTVASETGAKTAVLDPLEGLAAGSNASYLTVMDDNLTAVRQGQPCS